MRVLAQNLAMNYHDSGREIPVFAGLELDVPSGGSVAIVGASGVGKTTLLNCLGALEVPTSGTITIGDVCITDRSISSQERARFRGTNVGFVFQFHHLLPEFDALENVSMPLLLQGESRGVAEQRARELLHRVGLQNRLTHRPSMLSGGEQQRVAIARALVCKPGLILADEPTGNLDFQTGSLVSDLLLELHLEQASTLIVVTHSLELARKMQRILELVPDGFRIRQ